MILLGKTQCHAVCNMYLKTATTFKKFCKLFKIRHQLVFFETDKGMKGLNSLSLL